MRAVRVVLSLALALLLVQTVAAQDGKEKPKREGRRPGAGQMDPFRLPSSIELTAEQKEKVEALKKELGEKYKAAAKKAALTEEQRKTLAEAMKKAVDAGKNRREAAQEAQKSITLTEDQKKGREEARAVGKEIRTGLDKILTDEQKAKLRERMQNRRGAKTT